MKHIGNELNIILSKNKKIRKKEFAEKIGMTDVNLSKIFKKESVDSVLLEKISKTLNIPITFWFDEDDHDCPNINQKGKGNIIGNQNHVTIADCESKLEIANKEIDHLQALLEEKERTIQILMNK